jgi:hypothetical protein
MIAVNMLMPINRRTAFGLAMACHGWPDMKTCRPEHVFVRLSGKSWNEESIMSIVRISVRKIRPFVAAAILAGIFSWSGGAIAQTVAAPPVGLARATADNAVLLTVFLRHDQSRPLGELNAQLARQGFYKSFPPPGIEVVSWYVAMGIGQVITLRLPASRIREVNRVLEDTAWGVYHTEFYPTYDYKAIGLAEHEKAE